ncbi:DNA-binding transcriptional regulator, ArsR family [Rathayibacter oskolensis]|uniref:DNA-binding transcriptional regulator, ArsR family n=1 Tax=Rathayibacter oskolensis TaxID=1891671 RepID=A0A1X7P387_9MICO|nr:metalloregulator ArsR/SmtB family transcription factor [Rathayibacter oskolensis]SMH44261.1 DNA-binding transcriptional regulator, ArsR family [Rathayibacter oskolensis]
MSNDGRSELFPVPAVESIEIVALLKALADPARLRVVSRLSDGEYHPCTTDEYGLSLHKSTLSFHFKTLREAGLTETRVRGRDHAVRLRIDDVDQRFPGLLAAVLGATAGSEHPRTPAD